MSDTTVPSPAPGKRRGWLKLLAWAAGVCVFLLLAAYFVGTSSAFFKGFILPRASKALNAQITVSDASISLFSQVVLRDLKVQTPGTEPLLQAAEVRVRFSLMDILGGRIHVEELTIASPVLVLAENPDGTSNLDAVLKGQKATAPAQKPAAPSQPQKPMQIDVKKVEVTGGTLRRVQLYAGGKSDRAELSKLHLTVSDVKNGQTGRLELGADIQLENNPPSPKTNATLQARVEGSFTFGLAPDLKPSSIQGTTHLEIQAAGGGLADLARGGADLNCDVSPTEIKQLALRLARAGTPLGQVRLSGPFNLEKTEGHLSLEVQSIDKHLLNVVGTALGMDFGTTTVNSTNDLQLTKSGSTIILAGQVEVQKFQITRANQTTPTLDLRTTYEVTLDRAQSNAVVRVLTLTGTRQGTPLLRGDLSSPMTISWGTTASAASDSTLNLVVTNFDLADWKPFVGDLAPAGVINLSSRLLSQQSGDQLSFEITSQVANLTAKVGTNRVTQVGVTFQATGKAAKMRQFEFSQFKLELAQQDQTALTASASGTYDRATQGADIQITAQAGLARLLQFMPQPDVKISSGDAEFKARLIQKSLPSPATNQLSFDINSHIDNLNAKVGSNEVTQASFVLLASGQATDFKVFNLTAFKIQGARQKQAMLEVSGAGTYDQVGESTDMRLTAQASLAPLLQLVPMPQASVSSGTAELKVQLTQKQKSLSILGNLSLADFTGMFGKNQFRGFGTTADLEVAVTPQEVQIRKFTGALTGDKQAGGRFDLSGTYGLTNKSSQITAHLSEFNQNGLRPFLEPALADKKLVSVALGANLTSQYNPMGDSAIKGDLQVTNLVVSDPKNKFPATPLEARMQVDASFKKQVAEVRQFQLTLTPTSRANNQAQLTGRIDLSQTNAIQGAVKLAADALDVTSYYDLFVSQQTSQKPAGAPRASTTAPATAPSGPEHEPEAVQLPLRNFTADASIGRFYLRELEITNLQTTVKIDGGHVVLNPCKLAINGAPVTTTIDTDLGVPGYKYDLVFAATRVPMAPLVNTFQPERKGQVAGHATAQVNVRGAGITGASLQKNLTGQFDIGSTNLNLAIPTLRSAFMKKIVDVIAIVPSLVKDPGSAVSSLTGSIFGSRSGGTNGGWTDQLLNSPIDVIQARGTTGKGLVTLEHSLVQSPAFQSEAQGTVTIAEVLTNSALNMPLSIWVRRGLAEQIDLVPAGTPTNAIYAKLPNYVTIKGTIGQPKEEINKLALLGTVVKGLAGVVPALGGKTGSLLQGLGNALTGTGTTSTNPPGTNPPANNLLRGLGGLLGGNPPASDTPAVNPQTRVTTPPTNHPSTNSPQRQKKN